MDGDGDGGGIKHSAARRRLDQMVALASDDDKLAGIATALTDGLDGLSEQFDRQLAMTERMAEKFSALVRVQTTSMAEIAKEFTDHFKAVVDRVVVLESEVARLKGQAPGTRQ